MKSIRSKTSEMYMDEYGILHKTAIENCHINLESLKESEAITRQLTGNKKVAVFYDARNHFTITDEALEYVRKDIFNKQRIATAIVSRKTGIRIMVDYITRAHASAIPVKVFSNKEDALEWLISITENKTVPEHRNVKHLNG